MTARIVALAVGAGLAVIVALHPPWTAQAVRSRMSFKGFPSVPPTMVTDTASWRVPFAAVYSPPSIDLPANELAAYQRRLTAGDISAATEWRRRTEGVERRYGVPSGLRSVWIGGSTANSSNRGIAFRRSIVSSRFEVDRVRLGIYLLGLATATLTSVIALSRNTGSRKQS
ncbi:MAG: hypothetical protein H0U59_04540 [Gemmatimonadaceae bacterium]|nr:hypothetical protein [Gemmatimonadaceae bacterium]MDQ3242923.1 hypothetical protein [Gemmatimonadota bacterium]